MLSWAHAAAAQPPAVQARTSATLLTDSYRSGGIAGAIVAYEHTAAQTGKADPAALRQLAQWTVTELSSSTDEQVRQAACAATVAYSGDKACLAALQAVMGDSNNTFAIRLLAANALRSAHDPFADKAIPTLAAEAAAQHPVDAAAMLAGADPATAVPLLRGMLGSTDPQQQYAAATVLAGMPGKAAAAALADNVDRVTGAATIAAVAGLAAAGDPANRAKIVEALPLLRGADLLTAARALQRAGDARGTRALAGLLGSDDETVALEAAGSLMSGPERERAKATLHAGLGSSNPLVRAQAVKLWGEAGLPSDAAVRKLLADGDPWVRIQAAGAVMREAVAPAAPARR